MTELVKVISSEQNIEEWIVANILKMLDEGATIPFISRYRKEKTNSMNEVKLTEISERYESLKTLTKRKEYVIETISNQGKLTTELKYKIDNIWDSVKLEDIYLPYKPKRKTKAEIARQNGLEPLAKIIMSQKAGLPQLNRFYNKNISSDIEAIKGAQDIIAEWVSEDVRSRNKLRQIFKRTSVIKSKVIKGKEEEGQKYRDYFDFSQPLNYCSSHRYLAIRRGTDEGILKYSIAPSDDAEDKIAELFVKGSGELQNLVRDAVHDSYVRLLRPSIENEILSQKKEQSDTEAVNVFSENLRKLLLAPPLGRKKILAIDPGYRTGCKIVCLNSEGKLLYNDTIYPHAPQRDRANAIRKITTLIEQYKIEAIAIGNGTAGRETEDLVKRIKFNKDLSVFVVNEDGASVYSASKVAREEFPDYDVTVRGAVSIGRRLMDPLSELVKIDPKSIGVGQYQHDVDQSLLKKKLDSTVESCVNLVGVDLNTASKELLSYVSGLGPQLAQNIIDYRNENGAFRDRKSLLNVPRLGKKAYEQSAAFLKISNPINPLDNTSIHPERYVMVEQMAKDCGCDVKQFILSSEMRRNLKLENYISQDVGIETLQDIMTELDKPGRDPRSVVKIFEFNRDISEIDDLKSGMILPGIVSNVTAFGCFVDIGLKVKGLVHISELSNEFVTDINSVVSVNQQVKVKVIDIDKERKRISLSLKNLN